MKRDMDLIFAILKWRASRGTSGGIAPPDLPDWTRDQICYHAELCHERGLIQSYKHTLSGEREPVRLECRIGALTSAGHDELERMIAERR